MFNDGQVIRKESLNGIQITRSGFDGVFGDGSDVVLTPSQVGYIGVSDTDPEQVILRFAESLPDDLYRIDIFGAAPRR